VDQPWIFGRILEEASGFSIPGAGMSVEAFNDQPAWSETMASVAFGHAVVVLAAKVGSAAATGTVSSWPENPDLGIVQTGFLGAAPINPSFIYRGSKRVEMVIELPVAPSTVSEPELGYGLAMGELIHTIAREASDAGCPLLFVQSPTAGRSEGSVFEQQSRSRHVDDIDGRPWPATGAPAVRFAIAMPPDETSKRIDVCEKIAHAAQVRGGSISIGDYRLDRRGGWWYPAARSDSAAYKAYLADRGVGDRGVTEVLPMTLVGPARVGTTAEVLEHLVNARVPVIAASVSALENLAFIHVLIGLDDMMSVSTDRLPTAGTAMDMIEVVCSAGLEPKLSRREPRSLALASDYVGGVGPPRAIRRRVGTVPGLDGRAVWAAWQMKDRSDGLEKVIDALKGAVAEGLQEFGYQEEGLGSIDYAVCRRLDSGDARGRIKIALPPSLDLPAVPQANRRSRGELCSVIEREWRVRLAEALDTPTVDVEFTWQEERLGRWNALLSGALS